MKSTSIYAAMILVAILTLSGCAEQTIKGAADFANTAIAYQKSLPPLLDESFEAQLNVNSQELINLRTTLDQESDRMDRLKAQEKLMLATFETTEQIKKQVTLLESVFVALLALAQSDADSRISEASASLLDQLDQVTRNAADLEMLKATEFTDEKDRIGNIIEQGAALAIAQFKGAAIREFLDEHGSTILVSLRVQEELLNVISERLKFYGEIELSESYFNEVADPFVSGAAPNLEQWTANRRKHYAAKVDLERVSAAATAAANVRTAFVALAENRLTPDSIELIIADVTRIQGFLLAVRPTGDAR